MKIKNTDYFSHIIVFTFYLLLGLGVTYPVIFQLGDIYYGHKGDAAGTIWWFWWAKKAIYELQINPLFCEYMAAPFGSDRTTIPNNILTHYFFVYFLKHISPIELFNLITISTFVLSGYFMYLLALYTTRSKPAALLAGAIYALCPYHFVRTFGHIMLANIQWFPILILFLIKGYRTGRKRYFIASALTCMMLFATNFYYGYIGGCLIGIIACVFVLDILFWRKREPGNKVLEISKILAVTLFIGLSGLLFVRPYIAKIAYGNLKGESKFSEAGITQHPLKEISEYAARPLSYLMPPYYHPVLGRFTQPLIGSFLYGSSKVEHALFLGYFSIFFAVLYLRKYRRNTQANDDEHEAFMGRLFIFIAIAGILFSMPPVIPLGFAKLYFPSYFTYLIAPMFRNPARFGLIVMIGTCLLGAFGVKYYLEGKKKNISVVLLGMCVFIDFLFVPPLHYVRADDVSGVYGWMAEKNEKFIIAEYPMHQGPDTFGSYYYAQTIHNKPLINGAMVSDRAYGIKNHLLKLQDPKTIKLLGTLGVRYVIVHREEMTKSQSLDIIGVLPDYSALAGLKFIRNFGNEDLYAVESK